MSVRIADLIARTKRLSIRMGGQVINVTFKPGVITSKFLADTRPLRETLLDVITDWNLELSEGNPVPLTVEALEAVPIELINLIWKMIFAEVVNPHEDEEKKDSGDGSQPADK